MKPIMLIMLCCNEAKYAAAAMLDVVMLSVMAPNERAVTKRYCLQ
jgi:hypothetical protein